MDEDTVKCFHEFFDCLTRLLRRVGCTSLAAVDDMPSLRIFVSTEPDEQLSLRLFAISAF